MSAIRERILPLAPMTRLKKLGIIRPGGRNSFSRESYLLRYDFSFQKVFYAGFLCFDDNFNLVTIDQRFPIWESWYQGTEWVD